MSSDEGQNKKSDQWPVTSNQKGKSVEGRNERKCKLKKKGPRRRDAPFKCSFEEDVLLLVVSDQTQNIVALSNNNFMP